MPPTMCKIKRQNFTKIEKPDHHGWSMEKTLLSRISKSPSVSFQEHIILKKINLGT